MNLITSFYLFSLFFIFFQLYEILNRSTFYLNPPDVNKPLKYIGFYFTKVCSVIWIFGGIFFTDLKLYFGILLSLILLKYVPLLLKRNFYINLYDIISAILSIIIMIVIFRLGIAQL